MKSRKPTTIICVVYTYINDSLTDDILCVIMIYYHIYHIEYVVGISCIGIGYAHSFSLKALQKGKSDKRDPPGQSPYWP